MQTNQDEQSDKDVGVLTRPYNFMFGGNREAAIQRDQESCVKCGMTRQEHVYLFGRDITVDHIDGNGVRKPRALKNNALSNLQTLCLKCHSRKDNRQGKLSLIQAVNIRHMQGELSTRKIAKLYGISQPYVVQIHNNEWRTI